MSAYPHTSVFPAALGYHLSDFTDEERQRLEDVFCAAMSEAGWPTAPIPDPTRAGRNLFRVRSAPVELVEKARALALMSIGSVAP